MDKALAPKHTKEDLILQYLLFRFFFDGETVTNLKLQKVLYYVYVACLMNKQNCFEQKFQAWALGPVYYPVYQKLSRYGASAIPQEELWINTDEALSLVKSELGETLVEIIDRIYEQYGTKGAFELVRITHADPAWLKARGDLSPGERSAKEIKDEDVLEYYSQNGEEN